MSTIAFENNRSIEADLDPQFPDRWSPRSFSSEAVSDAALRTVFEAARWAPSCFNEQPWMFAYATDGDVRTAFDATLADGNSWAKKAPVLLFVCARKTFSKNGKENRWHRFDTGAAWMALALQARKLGLHTHPMAGFDAKEAAKVIGAPDDVDVIAAVALGYRAPRDDLDDEGQRESEAPNARKSQSTFAFHGKIVLD